MPHTSKAVVVLDLKSPYDLEGAVIVQYNPDVRCEFSTSQAPGVFRLRPNTLPFYHKMLVGVL